MKTYLPAGENEPSQTQTVEKAQAHSTHHLNKRFINKGFRRFRQYRTLTNEMVQAGILLNKFHTANEWTSIRDMPTI